MDKIKGPFWKTKSLWEMSEEEWESLCDGCGRCCLQKIEDEETSGIKRISVSCDFLDIVNCRCLVYDVRFLMNPDCVKLTPENVGHLEWLPVTCAYRCLAEGRNLAWWHPLLSGDPGTVHRACISVRDKVVPGQYVHPKDILDPID